MTRLLDQLEGDIPNVREVMMAALKNVRSTHLLDQGLLQKLGASALVSDDSDSPEDAAPSGSELPNLIQIL